jgi:hypothetical protein
LIDKIE